MHPEIDISPRGYAKASAELLAAHWRSGQRAHVVNTVLNHVTLAETRADAALALVTFVLLVARIDRDEHMALMNALCARLEASRPPPPPLNLPLTPGEAKALRLLAEGGAEVLPALLRTWPPEWMTEELCAAGKSAVKKLVELAPKAGQGTAREEDL